LVLCCHPLPIGPQKNLCRVKRRRATLSMLVAVGMYHQLILMPPPSGRSDHAKSLFYYLNRSFKASSVTEPALNSASAAAATKSR
jgi:hypothetical protein